MEGRKAEEEAVNSTRRGRINKNFRGVLKDVQHSPDKHGGGHSLSKDTKDCGTVSVLRDMGLSHVRGRAAECGHAG